jgi:hypothetical protein
MLEVFAAGRVSVVVSPAVTETLSCTVQWRVW